MFTGLVQAVGVVRELVSTDRGRRLVVRAPWAHRPAPGDSIAVSGVCLTACESAAGAAPDFEAGVAFDAVTETLNRSALGDLAAGSRVNLEHAARADTLLGGHVVQGHVDAVGVVRTVNEDPEDWRVRIDVPTEIMPMLAEKGSVTIDGVSLTIAESHEDSSFSVALIPTTLEHTTLGEFQPGRRVNVETDIIARQVVHALRMTGVLPS